ncbi:hypothetical protein LEP1GSC170_6163 [Leptospira interrogans serovar Bataviae str. HAI135]|nr:hypothetical protein LEP1GSC170_6163 [Leptospira interrogans serovar Bataviae str. HAI135]
MGSLLVLLGFNVKILWELLQSLDFTDDLRKCGNSYKV